MHKLTFYMKSGNSFVVDGIEDWELKSQGQVSELSIKYADSTNSRLIVPSIQLDQIEAIFREKY